MGFFGWPQGYDFGVGAISVITVILRIKSILWATFWPIKTNFQEKGNIRTY